MYQVEALHIVRFFFVWNEKETAYQLHSEAEPKTKSTEHLEYCIALKQT